MYQLESCSPEHPDPLSVLDNLSDALAAITGSSGRSSFDPGDVTVARALCMLRPGRSGWVPRFWRLSRNGQPLMDTRRCGWKPDS